ARVGERLELLLRGRQPRCESGCLLRVRGLLRYRQVRTAPVAATAGEHTRDVPALGVGSVAADDAEHPARAEHRRVGTIGETGEPVVTPLAEVGREVCACSEYRLECRLDLGVLRRDDGSVVLLVGVLHLVDDTLVGGAGRVEPRPFAACGE